MTRRLLLLGGIAILCVVLHHAGGWGQVGMFLWTDQYRPVPAPNWDQIGTLPYYLLLVAKSGYVLAVPAFLFISGFFVAYAARGREAGPGWKMIWTRIKTLLVPYLIWSAAIFLLDAFLGTLHQPAEYLFRLIGPGARDAFYYVPLLCYLYLLSPLLVPFARTRPWLFLATAALIQLGTIGLRYLPSVVGEMPGLDLVSILTAYWLPFCWIFFFSLGIFASLHTRALKQWLAPRRWVLLIAALTLYVLTLIQSERILRLTQAGWGAGLDSFAVNLCAVACILCFLAFERVPIPGSQSLYQLGKRSFGIYLLHPIIMEVAARGTRQVLPQLLAYPVLFATILLVLGLGGALLAMSIVARSPARRFYRTLFG